MMRVAIIIPYYQKRTGILRRALTSVLEQSIPQDVILDIIVADDGSPAPAQPEMEGLQLYAPHQLILVEQKNAGAAAARNAALQQVHPDTTYVAFLDSDDIWHPDHLGTALAALERGYDYYFCNNRRDESHECYFSMIAFDPHKTPVEGMEDVYEVDKKLFFDKSIRKWVSLTPTIVYRRSVDAGVEFDNSLQMAGEDCLFFLRLLSRCERICYSTKVLVTCADGVNIWQSRFGWDNSSHRISQLSLLLSEQRMRELLPLTPRSKRYLDLIITIRRRFFAYLTLRWFLKKRELWSDNMLKMAKSDPEFWLWYPLSLLYVAVCAPLRLYAPMHE